MEFYFCERNNGQGCLGTNYPKPKRGLGAFQEFLIRFRSLYGGNAYLCNGLNEYFSTVYDNLSSNMLIIRWGNKDNNFFGIRLNRMYFLQTIGSLWWLFCSVERQKKRFGTNHIKDELC